MLHILLLVVTENSAEQVDSRATDQQPTGGKIQSVRERWGPRALPDFSPFNVTLIILPSYRSSLTRQPLAASAPPVCVARRLLSFRLSYNSFAPALRSQAVQLLSTF